MNNSEDYEYKKHKLMFLIKQIHENIISIGKVLKEIKYNQMKNKVYGSFIINNIFRIDNYFNAREITIFEWHDNILNMKQNFDNDFIMILYERIHDIFLEHTDLRIKYKRLVRMHVKNFFEFFIELNKILVDDILHEAIIKQ